MEEYKLSRFSPSNEIIDYMRSLDNDRVVSFILQNTEDYGLYMLTLLEEIAKKENTSFWYIQLGALCTANLCYIDGANHSALYYYNKAHELEPRDVSLLNGILWFGEAPDYILTEEQKKHYASKLLELEPENEKALAIINS
ncbi:hypothetical protein [Psychrobacter sp. I-STPA6b]|uniref:hypothetical protein n=1 Tax=Psychrobacter sp. I-STPA6b TaxID=2585718 RepID=UPI001D0CCA09|nr:hypothetical protein [Psychrobacter sp. I-STPA6b]